MRAFALILLLTPALLAQLGLRGLSRQFEDLVEKTEPAFVQIPVRGFAAEGESSPLARNARGNGSGVMSAS
jgi:hypothetical protein